MSGVLGKRIAAALCAAGLTAVAAKAESVDFEAAAYIAEKTIVGSDGWLLNQGDPLANQDNFKIQSGNTGPGTGGKFLHALTTTSTTIYRTFGVTSGIIDVRWKWRASSENAHFCAGVAPAAGVARLANRALVCMEPGGTVATQGGGLTPSPVEAAWSVGTWHFMRMVIDHSAGTSGKFAVYMSDDSLRYNEHMIQPASIMGGSGPITRLVLRDEAGDGYVDVDDISWEATAIWQGSPDVDSSWSLGKNWSTGFPPDSNTHVIFNEASQRGASLDKNVAVRSITVAPAWKGTLNLGQQVLSVLGRADFSGGAYRYSGPGMIRFPSPRGVSLTGPEGVRFLPPVRHDGPGVLRLDGRALSLASLNQVQGAFDFNGFDLYVLEDLVVKNGQPATFRNLDGRSIVVSRSAKLEGTSKDTLLVLVAPTKNWTLNLSGTDTLAARFAQLGRASATGKPGFAFQSVDAGGNVGWTFLNAPAITLQPKDTTLKVGETALFKVTAAPKAGLTYQWMRNDTEIAGAKDSLYYLPGLRKADSGAVFSCKVTSPSGFVFSNGATLKVLFPPPAALPGPQAIGDSLAVQLAPLVGGSKVYFSRNGAPYAAYTVTLILKDSTTLRTFGTINGDTSAVAAYVYPKSSLPQLPEPSMSPESITFPVSLTVTMAPPVTGAKVYYTLDNSDPDSIKGKLYVVPLQITATTTVRAIAYLAGYRPSIIHTHFYTRAGDMKLGPPIADPAGGPFNDSQVVRLFPPAEAPSAAIFYLIDKAGPFKYSDTVPLVLRESATLKALAMADSRLSDTAQWQFQRRLETPQANPKARSFSDTLRVFLSTKVDGAAIRYTVDGTDPSAASPVFPGVGLLLDSSVDLKAVAVKGTDVSAKMVQAYTLIPDTPWVSHRGGDYSSKIAITLRASSTRAKLWYTLDGSTPGPESGRPAYAGPFDLDSNATLKVIAVAGQGAKTQRSPIRIENYTFISPGKRMLGPGQHIELSGNYALTSPTQGAAAVEVEVIAADSLERSLRGFRDVLFGIKVGLAGDVAAFPKVVFSAPAGEPRALFQLVTPTNVRFITTADTAQLAAPGTYFLATDTLAPVIKYSGETFTDFDSTRLVVTIEDNVSNLLLDVARSDSKAASFAGREIIPTLVLAVNQKTAPGSLAALTLRIRVDDHSRVSSFPADGSVYPLAQKFAGAVRTPAAFHIGADPSDPWDLVAIPLATDKALTLAQLRKNNSTSGLQGAIINRVTGKYRFVEADEAILPGSSIWLAAPASIPSFVFPGLQTVSRRGAGGEKLTLHPGWNQVANPTLTTLYWPVSRLYKDAYQASLLKGVHGWDASAGRYVHAEALEPWRGYIAWYGGSRDTVIDLPSRPVPAPAPPLPAKAAAAAGPGFSLRFALAGGLDLSLGASARAEDGMGREDEVRPPSRSENGTRLFSMRSGKRLETDLARWRSGSVYAWTVVAGLTARPAQGNPEATQSLAGYAEGLPEGYSAWAVSKSRGLRFPLGRGPQTSGAFIPWHPGFVDTLEVLAGPTGELEARLAAIPLKAGPFSARISTASGSFLLRLDLPAAARIRLTVWTLDGRAVEGRNLELPEGRYQIAGARSGRYPAGLYALQIEATVSGSPRIPAHTALKFAIP